jgi:hypothetical protein
MTSWPGMEESPFSLYCGNLWWRAARNAYRFEMEPPAR